MMRTTTRQTLYLTLAIAGLASTWYHNLHFMAASDGGGLLAFVQALDVNHATRSISWDITFAFLAFALWLPFEARRTGVRHWWLFLLLGGAIAFAFSFPLFLFFRERALARAG
ncbi:MAG: DUF2834 domain-containing protein [Alcanivoracaceae bacterium]|nr:DUF2834 domain-containing protein [Alcanivoracaceae bacterium]